MRRNPFRVTCNAKCSIVVVSVPITRDTRLDRIAPNEPTELDTRNSVAAAAGLVLFNAKRGRVCFVENFGDVKVAVGRERSIHAAIRIFAHVLTYTPSASVNCALQSAEHYIS